MIVRCLLDRVNGGLPEASLGLKSRRGRKLQLCDRHLIKFLTEKIMSAHNYNSAS